jgi:subtilisin family serine protease
LKRNVLRFILPFIAMLAIPFVYNSCQSGLPGSKAFASKNGKCKVVSDGGFVHKMKVSLEPAQTPFSTGKVKLRADAPAGALAKTGEVFTVKAGTELGLIMDNACLQEHRAALADSVLSKAALMEGGLWPQLNHQAYLWHLDRDYSEDEINALAEQEACVVGVSWNKEYKPQALNDTYSAAQIYLPAIHAFEAYDRFYAGGGMPTDSGAPVLLAAVDTGVDWTHPDLTANMWAHQYGYGVNATTIGTSLVDYNPIDISPIGHGTHVSGLMAAISNNATGITGAMPYRAKIMGIKVFKTNSSGDLTATSQYIYNGVKFAYLNGANVINISLDAITNGPASDSIQEAAFDEAIAAGATVVVALGNADNGANGRQIDGVNLSSIPAMFATKAGALGVGSFEVATGNKSAFSHYSKLYGEIAAPGAEQGTTGLVSTVPGTLGSYARLAGTSQAAPLVSAAAGLTVGLIRQAYGAPPTPAEVERLLLASAAKSPALTPYFKDGNRLDLLSLVQKINADYPQTASGSAVTPSDGCD